MLLAAKHKILSQIDRIKKNWNTKICKTYNKINPIVFVYHHKQSTTQFSGRVFQKKPFPIQVKGVNVVLLASLKQMHMEQQKGTSSLIERKKYKMYYITFAKKLISILIIAALTRHECSVLLTAKKGFFFFKLGVSNWLSKYQVSDQH